MFSEHFTTGLLLLGELLSLLSCTVSGHPVRQQRWSACIPDALCLTMLSGSGDAGKRHGKCWSVLEPSPWFHSPVTAVPMGCCSSRRVCFPTKCFNLSRDRGKAGGVWCAHGLPPCFTSWPREEESDSFVLCVNLCVTVLVRKRDCRNGFRSNRAAVPAIVPYWGNPVVIWQLFVCRIWGAGINMPPMTPSGESWRPTCGKGTQC